MRLFVLFFLSLALGARAEGDFHAYFGTENLHEGGQVEKLSVSNGGLVFNLRPPRGWGRRIDEAGHKIIFTSSSGRSAITVLFTVNSPGNLPDDDTLRAQAQQAHPGAGVVQAGVCPTSYHPGKFIDLTAVPAPRVIQRIRHAYVAEPLGEVEFILTSPDEEYDKSKFTLMSLLRAFRVDNSPAAKP